MLQNLYLSLSHLISTANMLSRKQNVFLGNCRLYLVVTKSSQPKKWEVAHALQTHADLQAQLEKGW